MKREGNKTNLPVFGFAGEHHGVLRLRNFAIVLVLRFLNILLGLDTLILREGAVVTLATGVGQEVRANRLHVPLGGSRQSTNRFEVLVGTPALRQGGQGHVDNLRSGHCGIGWLCCCFWPRS